MSREVIDVDDLDVYCTGVRHCIRIDRPPSPSPRKRSRDKVSASLLDQDTDDSSRPASSLRPVDFYTTELQRITQAELLLRTARLHTRSPNKRASDALKMAADAVKKDLKRKERVQPEVIEISSDSEPEIQPHKRHKVEHRQSPHVSDPASSSTGHIPNPEATPDFLHVELDSFTPSDRDHPLDDDDDDYINFLAALDISNEANWLPLPERNKAEDLTPKHEIESECITSKSRPLLPPHRSRNSPPVDYRHVPTKLLLNSPWGIVSRHYGPTKFPKPFFYARRREHLLPSRLPSLHYQLGYFKLALTAKYPHLTSGSVNKIIQAPDTVVLSAAVDAGMEDSDDDEDPPPPPPPPENKAGSLVVYHRGRVHVVPAHCHPRETTQGSVMRYYTVHDVAFNPFNSRQFLSSGYDHVVRAWEILDPNDNDERKGLDAMHQFPLDTKPQELVYSPEGSALAVSCHDGTVRLYTQDFFEEMIDADFSYSKKFQAAPRGVDHAAGCTLWGTGPSKHLIFTSSEPKQKEDFSGYHHAFDTHKGVQAVQFDATESGDAAALSPDGATLVLFTWGRYHSHPVRLYDVRRKAKEPYETEELEKFQVRPSISASRGLLQLEEVNQASFSPDGRLLAVARSDNALHVYDVRAVSRGPLCRFEHHDSDEVGGGGFGIIGANWVQGRYRIGLVSGGNDGCVRLWEPSLGNSEAQGTILGRSDFDVAHFSVGDRQRGELPLVIGDSGGGMHTYDFTNEDGTRI